MDTKSKPHAVQVLDMDLDQLKNTDHLSVLSTSPTSPPVRIDSSKDEMQSSGSGRWQVELVEENEQEDVPPKVGTVNEVARSVTRRKKVRVNLLDNMSIFDANEGKPNLLTTSDEEESNHVPISLSRSSEEPEGTSPLKQIDGTHSVRIVGKRLFSFHRKSNPDAAVKFSELQQQPSRHLSIASSADDGKKKGSAFKGIFSKDKEKEDQTRKRSASLGAALFKRSGEDKNIFVIKENALLRLDWGQIVSPIGDHPDPIIGDPSDGFSLELGQSFDGESSVRIEDEERVNNFFYRDYFTATNHVNFISVSEGIIISLTQNGEEEDDKTVLRAIIRTPAEDWRAVVGLPDNWRNNGKINKGVIRALKESHPPIAKTKLMPVPSNETFYTDLLKFETTQVMSKAKFGLLLRREGQTKEEEMFSNAELTPRFTEFLNFLGDVIPLQGHKGFTGGLDVKCDTTGVRSVFTNIFGLDIMFHVSTFLPHQVADVQQVEVKRHIGNDIVTLVFNDATTPFSPHTITSEFNHIYCVIQPMETLSTDTETYYRVGFASKSGVPPYGPRIPNPPIFKKGPEFRNFLFTKLINSECAALEAPSFASKLKRTRTILLTEIAKKHNVKKK
eukprot:TRINITY_DN1076_c0_g2_i1.p1 TRINITY_DN1076_c0_g2~~TRINITY_DN1076_c0_g2_i1.p1  ORF type:complete len:662 (-),score=153.65 TRINITY_DN1076_c0_g2_i1:58-1905(-)